MAYDTKFYRLGWFPASSGICHITSEIEFNCAISQRSPFNPLQLLPYLYTPPTFFWYSYPPADDLMRYTFPPNKQPVNK